jgi:acyl-CoA synthetase (AMP-forming)/AMP-acid ligase II
VADDGNFADTLRRRARDRPDAIALIEGARSRRTISFGGLESLTNRYARGLARHGVRAGDRALYLLPPSIDGYAVFYALLRLGTVPVLLDPRMGIRRLLRCIETVGCRVVLGVPAVHLLRILARRPFRAAQLFVTAGHRWLWGGVRLSHCVADEAGSEVTPVDPGQASLLPFTSGSTGPAKGVFYDHAMLCHQVAMMHRVCDWREGMHVVMAYAPFVPYALADGLTVILPDIDFSRPAAASPVRLVEAVTTHRAQCAFASPVVWMHLARYCQRHGVEVSSLERVVTAGAPASIDLHRRLLPRLHRAGRLYTPYGATEAMPITTTHTDELAETWTLCRSGYGTCVGRPLTGVEANTIRVTDDAIPGWSETLRVPADSIGEIVVGGKMVSPAYPDRPDETARTKIHRGDLVYHRTGDLGRVDADGRLWYCGRKSQRIETRDGMLAPDSVENVFNQHSAVFRSAAVGVGPAGDQQLVLCVELEAGTAFSPRIESELMALAVGTPFEGMVTRVLPHRRFPVDARHNSKIRRDELAIWARRHLGRRAGAR